MHPGGVFALCLSRKGTVLSAGKDRAIAEWETTDLVRRRQPMEVSYSSGLVGVNLLPGVQNLARYMSRIRTAKAWERAAASTATTAVRWWRDH